MRVARVSNIDSFIRRGELLRDSLDREHQPRVDEAVKFATNLAEAHYSARSAARRRSSRSISSAFIASISCSIESTSASRVSS